MTDNKTDSRDDCALPQTTPLPDRRILLAQKLKAGQVDGHSLVALGLRRLGVTHVYGISGTPVHETLAECAKSGLRVVGVRHQQAAAMMAAAQNYVSGRLVAAVILSAGPAITNAATGILVAFDNGWPLLVLGGRRPLHMREMGSFQELDGVAIFRSITKFAGLIDATGKIPESLAHACHVASSGAPGPVYLDVTEEALQKSAIAEQVNWPQLQVWAQPIDAVALAQAADILTNAERPAVIIGDGVRWSEPFAELEQLIARLNAPFITSPMARGFLPDDHPLCFNAARSLLLATADVVLALGAKLDWTFRYGAEIARGAKLIRLGIAREHIDLNVQPTVGAVGDIKRSLQHLLSKLDQRLGKPHVANDGWRASLAAKREASFDRWKAPAQCDLHLMTPQHLILQIRDAIPRDAICVIDGNVIMETAQQLLPNYRPVSRFTPGANGCMGTGVPFGIGAKVACPERPVVVISGDLAFGLSVMEMETAVRLNIPIIVIIANNDGNAGAIFQQKFYGDAHPDRVTMFAPDIRYDQIAKVFGGHAEHVERIEQLRPAFERALASGRPACINVKVDQYSPLPR
ncbi:MAG: thiamine pyrophosphate-binding protein [Burkholderiales bacterium]|nr:thiamine pyrophosphate-binding protein [Burkholderiales bacterium]